MINFVRYPPIRNGRTNLRQILSVWSHDASMPVLRVVHTASTRCCLLGDDTARQAHSLFAFGRRHSISFLGWE